MLTPEDEILFADAVREKDQGDLHEALRLFTDILDRNPDKPSLHYVTGLVHWNLGDLEQATSRFRVATELNPISEAMSLCLFHCLWDQGQQVEALEEAKRFITIAPSVTYRQIIEEVTAKLSGK